jgi:hypothetical protein
VTVVADAQRIVVTPHLYDAAERVFRVSEGVSVARQPRE